MADISIRAASPPDFDRARPVLEAAYAEYESQFPAANWVPYLADILHIEGRAEDSDLLIAELDGAIVACASLYPPGAKMAYPSPTFSEQWPADWSAFRLLAVDPSTRGSGVGRLLTEACIERARTQGAKAVGLHTTAPMAVARSMYERMGFERAPRYDFFPMPELVVEAYRLPL
jgi:GNAT superfamily N-acetyltransferase